VSSLLSWTRYCKGGVVLTSRADAKSSLAAGIVQQRRLGTGENNNNNWQLILLLMAGFSDCGLLTTLPCSWVETTKRAIPQGT
jgi:hypothetical protein